MADMGTGHQGGEANGAGHTRVQQTSPMLADMPVMR